MIRNRIGIDRNRRRRDIPNRAHIFLGPTRIATLEKTPIIPADRRDWSDRNIVLASIKKFLNAVEETFVGTAYADPPGTSLYFYHGDHLGSVNVITDINGAQIKLNEFVPFGSLNRSQGTKDFPTKFTGKRFDDSSGLYYYGARYYDPVLGRFTQPDTIVQSPSDPQTLNRYTYCRNNPLIYTDPSGHSWWKKIAQWLGPVGRTVVSAVIAAVVFVGVAIASGGNVQLAAASAAGAFSFTNTFLNASAQGASFGRALAAGAVNGAAAFGAVYFGWGAGIGVGAAIGASFGAAGGATSSAILGGDPGTGALSGGVSGAIMGAAGGAFGIPGALASAAGAGAASAAVSGGNVGQGAYLGAIGAASFAIASASFQAAIDAGRAQGSGVEADSGIASQFADRAMQPGESGVAKAMSQELRAPAIHALKVNIGLDVAGLVGSVVALIPTPITVIGGLIVSTAAGVIGATRTYGAYRQGWASGMDAAVSAGTTIVGLHPRAGVVSGTGQLAYDAYQLYDVSTKE